MLLGIDPQVVCEREVAAQPRTVLARQHSKGRVHRPALALARWHEASWRVPPCPTAGHGELIGFPMTVFTPPHAIRARVPARRTCEQADRPALVDDPMTLVVPHDVEVRDREVVAVHGVLAAYVLVVRCVLDVEHRGNIGQRSRTARNLSGVSGRGRLLFLSASASARASTSSGDLDGH